VSDILVLQHINTLWRFQYDTMAGRNELMDKKVVIMNHSVAPRLVGILHHGFECDIMARRKIKTTVKQQNK